MNLKSENIYFKNINPHKNEMEIFAEEVVKYMIKENILLTPINFGVCYERVLAGKNENLKKKINTLIELESENFEEKSKEHEKHLKQGFGSVKNMLNLTTTIYKNISLMEKFLINKQEKMDNIQDLHSAKELLHSLNKDVQKLKNILNNQSNSMKTIYNETVVILKQVEDESIYDKEYNVYNFKFLLSKLEQEKKLIKAFEHNSTLIMIEIMDDVKKTINNEKVLSLMMKTLSKLILKTSRRNDIVSHYRNGIFIILLKHTNLDNAKLAANRLHELVENSTFFNNDVEIKISIAIGLINISHENENETIISKTLSALQSSHLNKKQKYIIG